MSRIFYRRFLNRFRFMERLDLILEQAGKKWTGSKLISISLPHLRVRPSARSQAAVLSTAKSAVSLFAALGAFVPCFSSCANAPRSIAAFEAQFPEALDFLSRSMRAGHGFSIALEMLGTDSPDPLGPPSAESRTISSWARRSRPRSPS